MPKLPKPKNFVTFDLEGVGGVGVIAGEERVGDLTGVIVFTVFIAVGEFVVVVVGATNGVGVERITGVGVIGDVIGVVDERVLVVITGVGVIVEVTCVIGFEEEVVEGRGGGLLTVRLCVFICVGVGAVIVVNVCISCCVIGLEVNCVGINDGLLEMGIGLVNGTIVFIFVTGLMVEEAALELKLLIDVLDGVNAVGAVGLNM